MPGIAEMLRGATSGASAGAVSKPTLAAFLGRPAMNDDEANQIVAAQRLAGMSPPPQTDEEAAHLLSLQRMLGMSPPPKPQTPFAGGF